MSFRPNRSAGSLRRRFALAGTSSALAILLLVLAVPPGVVGEAVWNPDPPHWTNGAVLCQFAASQPEVNVSALSLAGTGLMASLTGMQELRPNGSVAAVAHLAGVNWTVANLSGEYSYDLAYSTQATVLSPSTPASVVGSVDLGVEFVLAAYAGSPAGNTTSVAVELTVANWTWQGSGDRLQATFSMSPTDPASERLNPSTEGGWLLANVLNASGHALEEMGFAENATAQPLTGSQELVSATSTLTISSPASAQVTVTFGGTAGLFRALAFSAQVAVVLPAAIAGIPAVDFLAVGGSAVAASLAIALFARRLRARPSRLIFADEERK